MTKTIELKNEDQIIEIKESCEINATFLGKKDDYLKSQIRFIHKKPNIRSRITIKALVTDIAHFDLEAILVIPKGSIGTDTYLKIECLILSDKAYTRAIPSLEINESEVKAGHGATIGYIDPEQIYYLTSHGLMKESAEELIIQAFLSD
jgi:Fe-S cluster assembly protein SufD